MINKLAGIAVIHHRDFIKSCRKTPDGVFLPGFLSVAFFYLSLLILFKGQENNLFIGVFAVV